MNGGDDGGDHHGRPSKFPQLSKCRSSQTAESRRSPVELRSLLVTSSGDPY